MAPAITYKSEVGMNNGTVRDGLEASTLDDEVRLLDAEWFMSYPHDVFARMRTEAPVYWSERDAVWALTKYDDVRSVSRTPELFANGYHVYVGAAGVVDDGAPSTDERSMPRRAELRIQSVPEGHRGISLTDGEWHSFLRKIASYAFTPKAINTLEQKVAQIAVELFDEIPEGVEVDFVDTVAAPLPMIMIALMLGVPQERLADFRRWSDAFIEISDETTHGDPEFADRLSAVGEFHEYFGEQLVARAAAPKDDLLTNIAQAEFHGQRMSLDDQIGLAQILLIAGNETTRGLISGAGLAMAEHPDQRQLLVDTPELVPNAVEEFLRWVTPVTHMCRTALEDTDVRGRNIRKGDYLCLLYPAANRDDETWDRADELDVTRQPDPSHLAFGFATHFCLGSNLARREARIVLAELLRRFPNYEIVGDVTRIRQHMTPGVKQMPVVFNT
jgi:cytochrome P450